MLELYQAESCSYSRRVREKLTDLGLSYVVHNPRLPEKDGGDVKNEQVIHQLRAAGGRDEIPYLVDTCHRTAIYESDEIIEYLEEQYG